MKSKFLHLIVILLVTLSLACSKKTQIHSDNVTTDLNIDSVAISENETITEGNLYFVKGDYSTAIDFYKDAMDKNKAVALYNIGVCYYLLNNIEQAELNFKEAVAADPKFNEAVMNLVAVLAQQEKITEAEKYISKIIYTTKSPRVFVDMANIALKQNDVAKSAFYYKKAFEIDSKSPFIISNYANFLISIGEYNAGIRLLEDILIKDFPINYNIANAYYQLKEPVSSYTYANDAFYSSAGTEEGYNKLAYLFFDLKRYSDEAKTLRILIAMNPLKDYRVRLVTSYVNLNMLDKALDELKILHEEYPKDLTLHVLYYDVLILSDNIAEGGRFIRSAYKKLGGDILLYFYTKHLANYEKSMQEVKNLIFAPRDNGWINLARTVYSLNIGDYKNAKIYLSKVPESIGHDYYSYKTFLSITNKSFREAEVTALKMNQKRPDTFWYRLVIAWNLKQADVIIDISNQHRNNPSINVKSPAFTFRLTPVIDDMGYSYQFKDAPTDAAEMLLFPLFLEPDEIVQFLIMGRSVLKDSEKENATNKLEGMKRNNEGIDLFYNYDFPKSLNKFSESANFLANNSKVTYNIGLVHFNLGDNSKAVEYFERAITQDANNPFAYFGLGATHERLADSGKAKQYFEKARSTAEQLLGSSNTDKINNLRLAYLAILTTNNNDKRKTAEAIAKNDDAFLSATLTLMDYFNSYDKNILTALDNSPVFRVKSLQTLLMMRHLDTREHKEIDSKDRYFSLAQKYIMVSRGAKSSTELNTRFLKDKVFLKDMVYTSILQNDPKMGLKYLQQLSNLDYTYNELYKASLYYFTWRKDFVNAEASYGTLDRMGYQDRMADFYKMLYFLVNYQEVRLSTYLTNYEEKYEQDYRSGVVSALVNLNNKNVNVFYNIMNRLLKNDPYLFNKMFIEVDLAKF